jgi:uncharacterized RDD family membrane protein YckC
MRCTKCHYLSFEPEPRCRNCGHDLSLEEGSAFNLANASLDGSSESAASEGRSARTATAVLTPPKAAAHASSRIPTKDLPLFVQSLPGVSDQLAHDPYGDQARHAPHGISHAEEDELVPLVKVPARPRTPVSVRRSTPDPARLRAKYGMSPTPEPDLWSNMPPDPIDQVDLREEVTAFQDLPLTQTAAMSWPSEPTPERLPVGWQEPVGAGARLFAAIIDATLLGGISAAVIYFTLQVTGLSFSQITLLPALPLVGLLLMMVVGYLLMFTVASGQTVGKMAMHLRVVGTSPEAVINDRITVSQAAVRTLAAVPSVLVFGLGFVPALLGAGLALHDRIAHTRVVRL